MIRVMRPPYGSYNRRTLRQAARAGFPTLLLWIPPATPAAARASVSMIKAALSGRNGSVVVLHCGPSATPRILRRIIEGYRAREFQVGDDDPDAPRDVGPTERAYSVGRGMVSVPRWNVWLPPATCPRRARLGWPSSSHAIALADGPLARCRAWAVSPLRGALRPAQDAQGPQRVPAAGLTVAGVPLEVDRALVRVLQGRGAVGLLFGADQLDRPARSSGRSPVEQK